MTRRKRRTVPALHSSTTDRWAGPASTWLRLHSCALGCLFVFFPFWFLFPFVLPVSTRGARGLPDHGDEPLTSGLAPHHHANRTTTHRTHPISAIASPLPSFSCCLPENCQGSGLGIGLEMGSRQGRMGHAGHGVVGMRARRGGDEGSRHERRCPRFQVVNKVLAAKR